MAPAVAAVRGKLAVSSVWGQRLTLVMLALGAGFGLVGAPAAQGPLPAAVAQSGHRAGIVVRFADGRVRERCVELGGPERTGVELLQLAGFAPLLEYDPLGAKVCAIDGQGCAYPAEPCWCRCQRLGESCEYWAYHVLRDGRWEYATVGAASRLVRHGDVDGWAWGPGGIGGGAKPPLRTFAELCPPAANNEPTIETPLTTVPPQESAIPSGTAGAAAATAGSAPGATVTRRGALPETAQPTPASPPAGATSSATPRPSAPGAATTTDGSGTLPQGTVRYATPRPEPTFASQSPGTSPGPAGSDATAPGRGAATVTGSALGWQSEDSGPWNSEAGPAREAAAPPLATIGRRAGMAVAPQGSTAPVGGHQRLFAGLLLALILTTLAHRAARRWAG